MSSKDPRRSDGTIFYIEEYRGCRSQTSVVVVKSSSIFNDLDRLPTAHGRGGEQLEVLVEGKKSLGA